MPHSSVLIGECVLEAERVACVVVLSEDVGKNCHGWSRKCMKLQEMDYNFISAKVDELFPSKHCS